MPEQNARRRRNARGPAALLVGGLMLTSLHASGAGAPTAEWTDTNWSGTQTVAGSVQAGVVPTPTNVRCAGGGVLQNPTVHWEMPSGATSPTGFRIEFYNRGLLGQRLGEWVSWAVSSSTAPDSLRSPSFYQPFLGLPLRIRRGNPNLPW